MEGLVGSDHGTEGNATEKLLHQIASLQDELAKAEVRAPLVLSWYRRLLILFVGGTGKRGTGKDAEQPSHRGTRIAARVTGKQSLLKIFNPQKIVLILYRVADPAEPPPSRSKNEQSRQTCREVHTVRDTGA